MDRAIATNADYVIVGAGSAGCVLAARLSEDPRIRVLLVEAGGPDTSAVIHVPVGYAKTFANPRYDWCYQAGPEPGLRNRTLHYARGKVLGGSSSINGLMWVRGSRADYDRWLLLGCSGWGYDDLLPYMMRSETYARGGPGRGQAGPVPVDYNPGWHQSMQLLVEAGRTLGLPDLLDHNIEAPLGLARTQVNWFKGRRKSAAATYLAGARGRPNLEVMTGVTVRSIVVENGAATGVTVERDGVVTRLAANAEVILSAGAIGSPLLLEASGIGDPTRLTALGIPVKAAALQVGENLRDHLYIMSQFRVRGLPSLNAETRGWRAARNGLQYLANRTGVLSGTPIQLTGFARAGNGDGPPDVQIFASPMTYGFKIVDGKMTPVVARDPGMSIAFYQRHPRSVGHVHLAGGTDVSLVCGFLTDEGDRRAVVAGLRYCRALSRAAPLANHIAGEVAPGSDVADEDDAGLLAFAQDVGISGFHVVGSCRMGADPASVVDLTLRARAVRRLRIVDASIMPDIVGANTHAPTVMIAERAADIIRAESR